jgi:hypothetical protein
MHKHLRPITEPIARYLLRTVRYSRERFIIELALIAFPCKMLVMIPWALMGLSYGSTTAAADTGDRGQLFFMGVIAAPLLETLIGQWIPIRVMYYFTNRIPYIMIGSAAFFAAQHLHVGPSGFVYTFPTALLLSWSFLLYRRRSRWEAYLVTAAIHALHNFLTLLLYVNAGSPTQTGT